jgi:hypothetical protein
MITLFSLSVSQADLKVRSISTDINTGNDYLKGVYKSLLDPEPTLFEFLKRGMYEMRLTDKIP